MIDLKRKNWIILSSNFVLFASIKGHQFFYKRALRQPREAGWGQTTLNPKLFLKQLIEIKNSFFFKKKDTFKKASDTRNLYLSKTDSGFSKWNSEKAGCSFKRSLNFLLISLLGLLIQLAGCFTTSCCTFFNLPRKQCKGVVCVLIRAVLFLKILTNIVKQCVSYSNFLNIWRML